MARIRQPHSDETKEKIRDALIANHPTRGMEKVAGVWVPYRKRNPRGFMSPEARKRTTDSMKKRSGVLSPNFGKTRSDETRKKISIAFTGDRHPMYGKHHTEETRAKMRLSRCKQIGDKASRWKGGITPLVRQIRQCPEYRKWRVDVFTRDDFTCVFCGIRGCFIEADHFPKSFAEMFHNNEIKSLEQAVMCEEFWNINNGRTLCRKCHDTTKKGRERKRKAELCLLN